VRKLTKPEQWSREIGELAVDALLQAKLLDTKDINRATDIIAEEVSVRLALGDYPAPPKKKWF